MTSGSLQTSQLANTFLIMVPGLAWYKETGTQYHRIQKRHFYEAVVQRAPILANGSTLLALPYSVLHAYEDRDA